ncbi:MAG: CCA tRNA nucleotidyltransferase [Muribaculaceae bacterium]|nr:CCA tRNA nucleotidyltransferase [Muribaculaceae bacterium]
MNLKDKLTHRAFSIVGQSADELGREAYVVGGYVRDIFLERKSKDVDFVTVGSGIELAKKVASNIAAVGRRRPKLAVYANYGTAQLHDADLELEFVGARRESYRRDSRNPIVEDGTLQDDMERRDFTINAMAICVNKDRFGELIDPFGGLADLARREIRTPLDPDVTFSDDPLRMMRAIRFATQLNFRIVPATFQAIKRNRNRIEIITKERINDELGKIMRSPKPSIGFMLLDMTGLLPLIFPELCELKGVENHEGVGHKDNFLHTLKVLDNVAAKSDNEWLRWAALLHDIAKPKVKRWDARLGWTFHNHNYIGERMIPRIFKRMKLPQNEKMKYVAKLVGLHMRPQNVADEGVSDSGVRRLSTDAGADLEDLMTLCEADITSKNPEKVRRQLEGFAKLRKRIAEINAADDYRKWKNPVDGNIIKDVFGIGDGPILGQLKQDIKDAILDCRIENSVEAALDYLLQLGESRHEEIEALGGIVPASWKDRIKLPEGAEGEASEAAELD